MNQVWRDMCIGARGAMEMNLTVRRAQLQTSASAKPLRLTRSHL